MGNWSSFFIAVLNAVFKAEENSKFNYSTKLNSTIQLLFSVSFVKQELALYYIEEWIYLTFC